MFHKLIFKVNTLLNIVLFLSTVIKFKKFAYLRPPIHLFYSNSFSPFFYYFSFCRGKFDRLFFIINVSLIFFFKLLDYMSLIKEKMKGVR